jgi:hypothetical protein
MIIVVAIMTLVGSSHRSALHNNYKQQAYFTALSAVRIVAEGIKEENEALTPTPSGFTYNANLTLPSSMGTVQVSMKRESVSEIIIKAEGDYLGVQDTVSLVLFYNDENSWEIWRYER